jgi:hypothetical protein
MSLRGWAGALAGLLGLALWQAGARSAAADGADKAPAALEPARVLRPPEGFFDDVLAFDADGHRLALVRTDDATFTKLEIFDVASGSMLSSWELGTARTIDAIDLLPDGHGALLIERSPGAEEVLAVYLDAAGRPAGKAGPATAFALAGLTDVEKKTILIGMEKKVATRADRPGSATYTISAFTPEKLAPIGKARTYLANADGQLAAPNLKIVGFFDGFSRLLGERDGGYDRQYDVRRPSRQVVLDTLTGKVVDEREIGDVYGWALATKLRAAHPNRTIFSQVDQAQQGVELVTADGQKVPLAVAIPFRRYDRETLQDQEGQGAERAAYYFSLAIDPVNPDAVARRKAERPYLDLYAVDPARATCVLRAHIILPRPVSWKVGGGALAVLKKFKSFTRGGDELDLYRLR